MTLRPETVELDDPDDLGGLIETMRSFTDRGHGWINVRPDVAADAAPVTGTALSRFFRRNSPDVALGTWMAPSPDSPDAPQLLGLQHGLGARIAPLLDSWGVPLAPTWRRTQDSPRRGLLVSVPAEESHETVLRWLLTVTTSATRRKTAGTWTVSIFEGRAR